MRLDAEVVEAACESATHTLREVQRSWPGARSALLAGSPGWSPPDADRPDRGPSTSRAGGGDELGEAVQLLELLVGVSARLDRLVRVWAPPPRRAESFTAPPDETACTACGDYAARHPDGPSWRLRRGLCAVCYRVRRRWELDRAPDRQTAR